MIFFYLEEKVLVLPCQFTKALMSN